MTLSRYAQRLELIRNRRIVFQFDLPSHYATTVRHSIPFRCSRRFNLDLDGFVDSAYDKPVNPTQFLLATFAKTVHHFENVFSARAHVYSLFIDRFNTTRYKLWWKKNCLHIHVIFKMKRSTLRTYINTQTDRNSSENKMIKMFIYIYI